MGERSIATVWIDLVDAPAFQSLTGLAVPAPVDARLYTEFGFPSFNLLQPTRRDIEAAGRLAAIRSIADLEGRYDEPLPIPEAQVMRLLRFRHLAA